MIVIMAVLATVALPVLFGLVGVGEGILLKLSRPVSIGD